MPNHTYFVNLICKIADHIACETVKLSTVRITAECSIALLKERRLALIATAMTGQIEAVAR